MRQPDYRHDERAVEVYWGEEKLGYVLRIENTAISQMLDRGERLSAGITRLSESRNPWERVRFAVYVEV